MIGIKAIQSNEAQEIRETASSCRQQTYFIMILRSNLTIRAPIKVLFLLCAALIYCNGVFALPSFSSPQSYSSGQGQRILDNAPLEPANPPKDAEPAEDVTPNNARDESMLPTYSALLDALNTMQSYFFMVSHGTWPDAIDWTAAVMGTQISAALSAMTKHIELEDSYGGSRVVYDQENVINRYFTQIASFYFGQNAFSLRNQAYDDMLWVVLGWLESIKFINRHSCLHYTQPPTSDPNCNASSWYARQFIPQFAHRAHLFYDLASRGWDTTLCGGGMVWNPYLSPYKNAITNQLFIAASVDMYLHFPGDSNSSPFSVEDTSNKHLPPAKAHDKRYLNNAVEGYRWLKRSGMRNEQGLYADGFHISSSKDGDGGNDGTGECDIRNEMVYTYNQGVLLSGLRGLWEATGSPEYLQDGHELIRDVIAATGWEERDGPLRWIWAGLGRNGILEEACDWSGRCSQNGQTFKGIFFHHFAVFCTPLPVDEGNSDSPWLGDDGLHTLHRQSCDSYAPWVARNAHAAYVTRDDKGRFGEWWGRPAMQSFDERDENNDIEAKAFEMPPSKGKDYRNKGVPRDEIWHGQINDHADEEMLGPHSWRAVASDPFVISRASNEMLQERDINDRGRGRTVETQSGGLAVTRAAWTLKCSNFHC